MCTYDGCKRGCNTFEVLNNEGELSMYIMVQKIFFILSHDKTIKKVLGLLLRKLSGDNIIST